MDQIVPVPTDLPLTVTSCSKVFFPCVRWLGYWLTPNLSSSPHISQDLGLGQGAFATVKRLSLPGSGLSPHLLHRLAISLLLPTLLYGVDLMTPTKGLYKKIDVNWHQVQRWVSNCFRSTPISILATESCLPLLQASVPQKERMAALWLVCAPPSINQVGPPRNNLPLTTEVQGS